MGAALAGSSGADAERASGALADGGADAERRIMGAPRLTAASKSGATRAHAASASTTIICSQVNAASSGKFAQRAKDSHDSRESGATGCCWSVAGRPFAARQVRVI
jgi:hypothetical protein